MKILRDKVEHLILGQADRRWSPLFQACCLNFDRAIRDLFGEQLTLSNELSLALQFSKPSIEQLAPTNNYELSPDIEAVDAMLLEGLSESDRNSIEFQFRVVYTLDAASKSHAHFQFVNPLSAEGKEIHNVLSRRVSGDSFYPHKPGKIPAVVRKETGQAFTTTDHTKAWRLFKARPRTGAAKPENTDKRYCLYHPTHGYYTYSDEWISMLVEVVN